MRNPYKALRDGVKYAFNPLTAVDEGWNYKPKRPVLSEEKKRELLANSALETPKSSLRAVGKVLWAYPQNASNKERLIFASLISAGMYLTYFYVQEQANFAQWMRGFSDTVIMMSQAAMEARPEFIDQIIENYPLLQAEMAADPMLENLLDAYPDSNTITRSGMFDEALAQSDEMRRLLEGTPPLEDLLMSYPGFAEKVAANPALLGQVTGFRRELADNLQELPNVKAGFEQIWDMVKGEVQAGTSGMREGMSQIFNEASEAASQWTDPENQQSLGEILADLKNDPELHQGMEHFGDSFDRFRYSKDMVGMLSRFVFGALFAYKTSQYGMMRWRGWTTGYYVNKFTNNRAYLGMNNSVNSVDNPGQRLQEDPNRFTEGAFDLLTSVQSATITFFTFAGVLNGLGPFLGVPYGYTVAAAAHAGVMVAGMFALGWKLPNVQREQQMREAYLRKSIDKISDDASAIALNRTEDVELQLIKQKMKPVITNSMREVSISLRMTLYNLVGNNATIPFPWLIAGIAIAGGTATAGTAMTINSAFNAVSGSLGIVASKFKSLSYLLATAGRIHMYDQATDLQHYQAEERRQMGEKVIIPDEPPKPKMA